MSTCSVDIIRGSVGFLCTSLCNYWKLLDPTVVEACSRQISDEDGFLPQIMYFCLVSTNKTGMCEVTRKYKLIYSDFRENWQSEIFSWNFILKYIFFFQNSFEKFQVSPKCDNNNGYFVWRSTINLAEFVLTWETC